MTETPKDENEGTGGPYVLSAGLCLMPCPFCGWAAEYGIVEGDNGHPDIGAHFIGCTNDLCAVSTALVFPYGDEPKSLLVEKWNRRSPPLNQVPGTAIARVVESDDFSAEVSWLLNPLPPGTLLYEA